jgi:hypothetical protein
LEQLPGGRSRKWLVKSVGEIVEMLHGPTVLGIDDSGKRVTIDVGDKLIVQLPGKETPGYGWVVTPGDPSVLGVEDGTTAGTFTFVGKGSGTTHLIFAYRHPWENRKPIQTVSLDVQVGSSHWFGIGVAVGIATTVAAATYALKRKRRKKR